MILIDTNRVKQLRVERGIGLLEAKKIVERETLLAEIDRATTIYDLKAILRKVVP